MIAGDLTNRRKTRLATQAFRTRLFEAKAEERRKSKPVSSWQERRTVHPDLEASLQRMNAHYDSTAAMCMLSQPERVTETAIIRTRRLVTA